MFILPLTSPTYPLACLLHLACLLDYQVIITNLPDVTVGDDFQDITALLINTRAQIKKIVAKQILNMPVTLMIFVRENCKSSMFKPY